MIVHREENIRFWTDQLFSAMIAATEAKQA